MLKTKIVQEDRVYRAWGMNGALLSPSLAFMRPLQIKRTTAAKYGDFPKTTISSHTEGNITK
jgi:hypothetical protein